MAYIPDLGPYDYYRDAPDALAVGWLDETQDFTAGTCPSDVRDRIAQAAEHPVRLMRGYHYCQFCWAQAGPPVYAEHNPHLVVSHDDVAHGNGELWFTAPDGIHYAAPTLVVHYIDEHGYMPPPAFISAVREGRPTQGLT